MNSDVEKIKDRLNIVDVVSEYVTLTKAGKNMRGLSPFTNEKSPSFFVSPDRQLFHCFSSGKGGDMFTFIQEIEGLDFPGSLKLLADKAGIKLTFQSKDAKEKYDTLYTILDDVTDFYARTLETDKQALTYLTNRGVSLNTIEEWRLGYAPDEWRKTLEHLTKKGYSEDDMKRVGLIKIADNKKKYDTFRGRIMFPLFDVSGRVIAFSGRILKNDTDAPKYVNSPETPLFNKSEVLYGLDKAKTSIRRQDYVILVEGQMDVVMSHQAGLTNTVASSGTALTELQLNRIKRYTSRLIVAFDSDQAGFTASAKNAEVAMKHGFDVKIAPLPENSDPAELIKEDPKKYRDVLASSQHIVDFYVDRVMSVEKDTRTIARRIRMEVLPLIKNVESALERAHFLQRIAQRTGLPEEAVREDFKDLGKVERSQPLQEVSKSCIPRKDSIIRELYGVILWKDSKNLQKRLEESMGREKGKLEELDLIKDQLVFEAETKYGDEKMFDAMIEDLFMNLDMEYVRDQFTTTMKALAFAEKEGDAEKSSTLLKKCQELTEKLAKYNNI